MRTITVGGLAGTGTTTLCRLLQQDTGLPYVYAGRLFREEAARRGLDLEEFGRLCERDDRVDRELDRKQVELLQGGPLLLEGRLAGWLAHQQKVPSLKVWVVCEESERARRLAERDGDTTIVQARHARTRQSSEMGRYQQYYGIDLDDLTPYDLVLDSTVTPPDALAAQVLAAWRKGAEVEA